MKVCTNCKQEKDVSSYGKNHIFADGLNIYCKQCTKNERDARKEQTRIYDQKWYEQNKARSNKNSRTWHEQNRDYHVALTKQYRKDQKDKIAVAEKDWRTRNKAKVLAARARRRAQKLCATPVWANSLMIEQIYNEAINLTKVTGIKHHVDHVVPLLGKNVCGLHVETNLQILTRLDNLSKSNKF